MKRYLVLYRATATALEQMHKGTPEQQKAGMDAWLGWMKKAGPAIVETGSPIANPQKYASSGAAPQAGDATIGGYSVVQAESKQKLAELFDGHPHFLAPGATIEVHEIVPM